LGDAALDQEILKRIRNVRFKEKDVIVARLNYTYNFLVNN